MGVCFKLPTCAPSHVLMHLVVHSLTRKLTKSHNHSVAPILTSLLPTASGTPYRSGRRTLQTDPSPWEGGAAVPPDSPETINMEHRRVSHSHTLTSSLTHVLTPSLAHSRHLDRFPTPRRENVFINSLFLGRKFTPPPFGRVTRAPRVNVEPKNKDL